MEMGESPRTVYATKGMEAVNSRRSEVSFTQRQEEHHLPPHRAAHEPAPTGQDRRLQADRQPHQAPPRRRWPITDLVTELDYPALAEDVREVLRALIFQKRYTAQTTELRQSRADLVTEKGRKK